MRGLILIVAVLLCKLLAGSGECCGPVTLEEYNALEQLYNSTNGPLWSVKQGIWTFDGNLSEPCCGPWQGLNCTSSPVLSTGCVVENMYIRGMNLSGYLPESIGNFSCLKTMDLFNNSIQGTIPLTVSNLLQLERLQLPQNLLSGSIPSEIGLMTMLQILELETNLLTGRIPSQIGQLSSLTWLYLSNNSLTGTIPNELSALVNLQYFVLSYNDFSGSIPASFQQMTKMYAFAFQNNRFTGPFLNVIEDWAVLNTVNLNYNDLTGTIPSILGSSLAYLMLGANSFSGTIPTTILNLELLVYLFLDENLLTGTIPTTGWGNLTSLQVLSLNGNSFTSTIPANLGALQQVFQMTLASNALTGSVPLDLTLLSSVQLFYLTNNYLTGSISAQFSELAALGAFDISSNSFEGTLPDFSGCSALVLLNISNNRFVGRLPAVSSPMQYYDAAANRFLGGIPSSFQYLSENAIGISISQNSLDGTIPAYFSNFRKLQFLNLSSNSFTGSVGPLVVPGGSLIVADLSSNRFSGSIPSELFTSGPLQTALLYHNCFSGTLPVSMCENINLEQLGMDSLSSNCGSSVPDALKPILNGELPNQYLSGSLPTCLWGMSRLKLLRFSGNGLFGTIPQIPVSSQLSIVIVSSNRLTGTIPESLQTLQTLFQLDLSENRLSGTLSPRFRIASSDTLLDLSDNRLSGSLPSSLHNTSVVNVLEGNLFECEQGQLPPQDPNYSTYVCGSDDLNTSLFTALVCFGIAGAALLASICFFNVKLLTWRHSAQEDSTLSPLLRLELLGFAPLFPILLLILLLFVLFKMTATLSQFSTHSIQLGWVPTAAFLQGWAPAVVIVLLLIGCFISIVLASPLALRFRSSSCVSCCSYGSVDWSSLSRICAAHVINITVVFLVNVPYILLTVRGTNEVTLALVQFGLGTFKLFWNIAIVVLFRRLVSAWDHYLGHVVFMRIFAFIGGPLCSVFFSDSDCFLYVLVKQSTIFSYLQMQSFVCETYCSGSACDMFCFTAPDSATIEVSTVPPWLYSYQCSSALLTNYIPVLVYTYILSGVMMPAACTLLLTVGKGFLTAHFPDWALALMFDGSLFALSTEQTQPLGSSAVVDGYSVQAKFLQNLAVILTFGLSSPIFGLIVLLETCSHMITLLVLIRRFVQLANATKSSKASNEQIQLGIECRLDASKGQFLDRNGEFVLTFFFAGLFWGLFVFDFVGGAYGSKAGGAAAWIPMGCAIAVVSVNFYLRKYRQRTADETMAAVRERSVVEMDAKMLSNPLVFNQPFGSTGV